MDSSIIYILISVSVVSAASLVGVLTISLTARRLNNVIFIFVALAIGALLENI